jgi:tetratricopeptide (TPR) repeat protein
MSIDLRTEFAGSWSPLTTSLAVAGFLGYGALGSYLLLRRAGFARVAGFGLLLPWVLFLTEFATIRYQEPFVLYRSYLWAPGWAVLLAAALSRMPIRALLAFALLVLPLLFFQAHDRLRTFSSGLALWEDAAAKLPHDRVPGGSRTLYNLGREYLYAGRTDLAVDTAERCLARYPATFDCHMARAAIHLEQEEFERALPHLDRALELQPASGAAHHNLGLALENLGRVEEAKERFRRASALGFKGADYQLGRLESPGSGLLPPRRPH